jgi:protein-S-isoprenylcysteine O-methyltransferase Ste14
MTQSAISAKARSLLILRAVLSPIVIVLLLFLLAGRWDFWQGWVYLGLILLSELLMAAILNRNKGLIEERLNPKEGMKTWDKVYFGITTPLYFITIVLGALDARFGWTPVMPFAIYGLSVALYIVGQAIFLWARNANNYFSSVVRIQADRGQTVCKDGPYHYVRHPGYVGGFLFTITVGWILGSWWATIPQVIAALLLVWRTALEDKTLQAELPGYTEYAKETRYRLIPGLW